MEIAPAPPQSSSKISTTWSLRVTDPPQPKAEAPLPKIFEDGVHPSMGVGHPLCAKTANLKFPLCMVLHPYRLGCAKSLGNGIIYLPSKQSTPGIAKENDTPLSTKRWRHFTEITEHPKICQTRLRNFSFLLRSKMESVPRRI